MAFTETEVRFLTHARVGRLATHDGEGMHVVPMCPAFDGRAFYMATHARARTVQNLSKNGNATLLVDQYSEDWMRNVGTIISGTAEVHTDGPEFEKGVALLEAKFRQYESLFPIRRGESVVIRFTPSRSVGWDYARGDINEPH